MISRSATAAASATASNEEDDRTVSNSRLNNVALAKQKVYRKAQTFAETLMSTPYEDIPDSNGMKVLRNILILEGGNPMDIVVRNNTIPFWEECIKVVDAKDGKVRVAAIGSPGIGKTTATPILIRMLLERGKTVVYLVRTSENWGWYYEFIPDQRGQIACNIYRENTDILEIASFQEFSTYYIVDPGLTKDTCNPPRNFQPKVIIVASPDTRHWGNSEFEKMRDGGSRGIMRYFPVWSKEELYSALPILGKNMTQEQLEMRYRNFGGVPRHIFISNERADEYIINQDIALNVVMSYQVEMIVRGDLFAVDIFDTTAPKGFVMGFGLSEKDDGTFSQRKAIFLSDRVAEKVYLKFMGNLWKTMLNGGRNGWNIFETYTRALMANGQEFLFLARDCVGERDKQYNRSTLIRLGGCTEIRLAVNPLEQAKDESRPLILFYSVDSNFALINFAYKDIAGDLHGFQVVQAKVHDANVSKIIEYQNIIDNNMKLSLYYLVPDDLFQNFVTNPVDPKVASDGAISIDIKHVLIPNPDLQRSIQIDETGGENYRRGSTIQKRKGG